MTNKPWIACSRKSVFRVSSLSFPPSPPPQVWAGHIEVTTGESLSALAGRLRSLRISCETEGAEGAAQRLRIRGPWGNLFQARRGRQAPSCSPRGDSACLQ